MTSCIGSVFHTSLVASAVVLKLCGLLVSIIRLLASPIQVMQVK